MLSRWVRVWYGWLLKPLLTQLAAAGLTPNMLTISGLVCLILAGWIVACGYLLGGGVLLLMGGICDGLDGELARQSGSMTPFGGLLDSLCDHCGDFAFSLGLLWLYLSAGATTEIVLVFVAMFGSLFGSQVRSRAGMLGIELKDIGLVTRFERILLWIIGIFTVHLPIALWTLAVLNNVAAFQRIAYVVKQSAGRSVARTIDILP